MMTTFLQTGKTPEDGQTTLSQNSLIFAIVAVVYKDLNYVQEIFKR